MRGSAVKGPARRWLWISAVVLTALVAVAVAAAGRSAGGEDPWVRVERRDLTLTVPVTGELRAAESIQLGPPQTPGIWNFKITFMAPEGSDVAAGEPVLRFDDTELRRELERVTAELETAVQEVAKLRSDADQQIRQKALELAEAEAKLRKARLKLEVPESLKAGNEIRAAEIDHELARTEVLHKKEGLEQLRRSMEAQIGALEDQRDRARVAVGLNRQQLDLLTVKAPRAGTVIYLTSRRGEKKKLGDNCWWGERVIEIPDLDRMVARGEVEEVLAGRLKAGQVVRLRLDAFPDTELTADIRSVDSTVQRRSRFDPVKVVRLKLDLRQTDPQRMRPGMRFQGEVEVERIDQALAIPLTAIAAGSEGPRVEVKEGLRRSLREPRLGRRAGRWVEVLDGLSEGELLLRTAR